MICCLRGPQSRGSVGFPVGFTPGPFDFNAHGRVWSLVSHCVVRGETPSSVLVGAVLFVKIHTRVFGFRSFGSSVLVLRVYFPVFWVHLVPGLFLVFRISVVRFWFYGLFCGFLGIIWFW